MHNYSSSHQICLFSVLQQKESPQMKKERISGKYSQVIGRYLAVTYRWVHIMISVVIDPVS